MRNVKLAISATVLALGPLMAPASAQPRTTPRLLCGIPDADYQYRLRSDTLVQSSTPVLLLQQVVRNENPPNTVTVQDEFKAFQLPVDNLRLNGRKISRIAFLVHRDGTWSLSLRADFHDRAEAIEGPFVDAEQRRCQFRVKVNCFGAFAVDEPPETESIGRPIMLTTPPIEFWVQSGVPYDLWRVGTCPGWDAATRLRVFELIERVEVEFAYYEPVGYRRTVRDESTGR